MSWKAFAAAALLCAAVVPGSAGIVTSHIATDAEMLAQINDLSFVAEGRIGDRGHATYEVDIDTGAVQAQYKWRNGIETDFSIVYNSLTDLVTFTVGSVALYYPSPDAFTDFYVRTRAADAGSSMVVDDLALNGVALVDASVASRPGGGLDILWVRSFADPTDGGFTLTGHSTMSWTHAVPTQSHLAYQVMFDNGSTIPEPASIILLIIGLAAMSAMRRK